MTYRMAYDQGRERLTRAGITEADCDARLLLEHICHTTRNDMLMHPDREVTEDEAAQYMALILQREKHVPLQHLTGVQCFMGLDFIVNEHVLIPRQDTEILVEEAMQHLHDGMRILDMCTGSGCILISLLHYSNDCEGVGVDLSEHALEVARRNAMLLEGKEKASVSFIHSDLFEHVEGQFDMIVSNPPYIRSDVIPTLMEEVRDYEPHMALDGDADGLRFYHIIAKEAYQHLCGGGYLFFEIGYDQGIEVSTIMENAGYAQVEILKDYAGLDRVVYGYRPMEL